MTDKQNSLPLEAIIETEDISNTSYSSCNYLPNRIMQLSGFIIHSDSQNQAISAAIEQGYRRSGHFFYQTNCPRCQACIPVRIAVERFKPNRTQRRTFRRRQATLSVRMIRPRFVPSHFDLYSRYLAFKHPDSEMTQSNDAVHYHQFILQSPAQTYLFEFHDISDPIETLRMVSVMDDVADGLSAVYTFYDPAKLSESLGTFSILWQIQLAKDLGRPYLYLGYYIEECPQMAYKKHFSGLEMYVDGKWQEADIPDG